MFIYFQINAPNRPVRSFLAHLFVSLSLAFTFELTYPHINALPLS